MTQQPIRFAVIGAGNRGAYIAQILARDFAGETSLNVICDVNEAAAKKAKQEGRSAFATTDYQQAVSRTDVDAVVVAVPPGLHRDIVVASARAGKHVLCEKPISIELSDADQMIAECNSAGIVFSVGYFLRLAENRSTMRQTILDGTIGRPVFWRETLPLYEEGQRWLGDYRLGGGALFEYSHSIDFACYVFGKPRSVFAQMMKFQPDSTWGTHDAYNAVIHFESGDTYQISGFGVIPMGSRSIAPYWGNARYRENDVVGPRGHIFTGELYGKRQMIVTENLGTKQQTISHLPWDGWAGYVADPTALMLRDFLECIRDGRQSAIIPASEARQTLAIIHACLESSRRQESVRVAREGLPCPMP